jgi:hypothetical protein
MMHPVLNWLRAVGLRLATPVTHTRAFIKVMAVADVMSLTLLRMLLAALALGAAAGMAWPGEARATVCQGQIGSETSITGKTAYDPYSPAGVYDSSRLTIRNVGDAECGYALLFRARTPDPRLGGTLVYGLADGGRPLLTTGISVAAAPGLRTKTPIPASGGAEVEYQVQIPRGQFAAPGQYQDVVDVELYALDAGGGLEMPPLQATALSVTYTVTRVMSVNIKGGGTATTLSFGALSKGQRMSVDIQARSNEPYQLYVTSDNGGAMVLTPKVPGQDWRVGYTAALGGEALNLGAGSSPRNQPPVRPENDASHELTVTTGDVALKRAGRYEDVITVEIRGANL